MVDAFSNDLEPKTRDRFEMARGSAERALRHARAAKSIVRVSDASKTFQRRNHALQKVRVKHETWTSSL